MAMRRLDPISWVGEGSLEVDSMEQAALFPLTPDLGCLSGGSLHPSAQPQGQASETSADPVPILVMSPR